MPNWSAFIFSWELEYSMQIKNQMKTFPQPVYLLESADLMKYKVS